MFEGLPENYSEHLQDVSQELMNGSLDKDGAVIRLVRQGWNHEEAHAAVTEIAEQVDTTNKLLRDAGRVLDGSPSGQARANARLREAGFSTNDATEMIQQIIQRRQVAMSRFRDVLRGIRQGALSRRQALDQLSGRGMDSSLASTLIDVFSDSATFWAKEWLTLSAALCGGALLTSLIVFVLMFSELDVWLGAVLGVFVAIPVVVLGWSWKNWKFWSKWTRVHQGERECPRSCSPMVMLMTGKGRSSTILTAMEWGLSRDDASLLVRRRADLNVRAYFLIASIGLAFLVLAVTSTLVGIWKEPGHFLNIALIDGVMALVGCVLIYRGILGWRCFRRA